MNAPARLPTTTNMPATWCDECDEVHSDTRSLDPWRWRCHKAPTEPGFGFVSQNYSPHPPYELCSRVNVRGECPHFKAKRIPKIDATNF